MVRYAAANVPTKTGSPGTVTLHPMTSVVRDERSANAILSWVAGYIDTAGFLGLNGLFTAHVTGNLVVAGAELAGAREEAVWVRLAVIPVFIAAVMMTSVIARTQSARLSQLLWLEAIALLGFAVIGIAIIPIGQTRVDAVTMFTVGSVGVFAMGVRNTLMRESLGTMAQTTVMTGNLTQFVISLTRIYLLQGYDKTSALTPQDYEIRQTARKFGSALMGFGLGAIAGAFFMRTIGFWSILLPAIAIAILALDTCRHEHHLKNQL